MTLLDTYATHSRFTDPGGHADWLDGTAADLAALRETAPGLVFHYWATATPPSGASTGRG